MNQRIGVVELVNDDWLRYSQLTTITLIGSTRFKSRFLELSNLNLQVTMFFILIFFHMQMNMRLMMSS